jgi:hypothetical protein
VSNSRLILKKPCRLCGGDEYDSQLDHFFFTCLSCGSTAPRNFSSVKYTCEGDDTDDQVEVISADDYFYSSDDAEDATN